MNNLLFLRNVMLLFISCFSFIQSNYESIKYKNYCTAIDNYESTYQYYTVINIRNKVNNTEKEICITGSDLIVSISKENTNYCSYDYDKYQNPKKCKIFRKIKNNKNRTFKIKSKDALDYLTRINYSKAELIAFDRNINIDSIIKIINKKEKWNYWKGSEKEQVMIAHLLFNKGILLGVNECAFSGLEYTKP